jgi:ribosomal-protein-alanine N-acetyltransferase
MVARARRTPPSGFRIALARPTVRHEAALLAAVRASRAFHAGFVVPPTTPAGYREYLARFASRRAGVRNLGFFAVRLEDRAIAGVLNLSEIVRGAFESTYLGYYALAPHAAGGYMAEAMVLVLDTAFDELGLHRVEANVQPVNARSLALVERAGFSREGYSRRYVKVGGRWRDHVRFAMLAEDWPGARRRVVAALKVGR